MTDESFESVDQPRRGVGPRSIQGRLAAGVITVIPLAVTVFLIRFVYDIALRLGIWLFYWFRKLLAWAAPTWKIEAPTELLDPADANFGEKITAVCLTILTLYFLGWLGSNVVGRRIIAFFESMVDRIPLVHTIYGSMKRMVVALSGTGKGNSGPEKRVVLVDFPHENMRAIAFMTSTVVDLNTGQQYATVYVPTTPNPTGGYMELVPMDRVTKTDWSMEEALSIVLSGGAAIPPSVRLVRGVQAAPATFPPSPEPAPGGLKP